MLNFRAPFGRLQLARINAKQIRVDAELGNDPKKTNKPITLGDFLEKHYKPEYLATHRSAASLDNINALASSFNGRLIAK